MSRGFLCRALAIWCAVFAWHGAGDEALAQDRSGAPPEAPVSAQASAPVDVVGYWVSVVNEDWRWRMVTPARGDVASIPLNQDALDFANQWDPVRDTAVGEACKSYGAPGLLRHPGRLRITWADVNTLQVETDAGTQTRLLRFGSPTVPAGGPSRQGHSVAKWGELAGGDGQGAGGRDGPVAPAGFGTLHVDTINLLAGYLRKNGVPHSENTVLTEHWNLFTTPFGRWLVVTTIVHDPQYLQDDWITSLNFRQESDGAGWDPRPCTAQ